MFWRTQFSDPFSEKNFELLITEVDLLPAHGADETFFLIRPTVVRKSMTTSIILGDFLPQEKTWKPHSWTLHEFPGYGICFLHQTHQTGVLQYSSLILKLIVSTSIELY